MSIDLYTYGICFIGLTIALIYDVWKYRIPNQLTVSLALVGLANGAIQYGWSGFVEHVLGMLAGLGIFFIPYLLGAYGAGDVKMMAAIGAVMGLSFIVANSLVVIAVGGVIAMGLILRRKGWRRIFHLFSLLSIYFFTGKMKEFMSTLKDRSQGAFPYGIAIFIGTLLTMYLEYAGGDL